MIFWEEASLNDREKIFEFLYDFNPAAAEKTDELIETKVENLLEQPLMGFSVMVFEADCLLSLRFQ